ncbi:hypothetical protein SAMN05421835_10120 [Amycolatopsis sacchari]|uniref:Uncharacterized protein n=1 Tax=Amycolatopsis sacchari TaxID=115433 RepID=A0A1I3J8L3_9PSEU|nr:hypothetical protein SAMN05421835_10120 [Amycolatopsis sacchari]
MEPGAPETARGYHDSIKGVDARGKRCHALSWEAFREYWTRTCAEVPEENQATRWRDDPKHYSPREAL